MKKLFLLLLPFSLYAQQQETIPLQQQPAKPPTTQTPQKAQPSDKKMMAVTPVDNARRSIMVIDPKARADDIMQAYDLLKKDKPTYRISLRTYSGQILSNILDITMLPNGTWLLFHLSTLQGVKTQILSVDDIMEIFYS